MESRTILTCLKKLPGRVPRCLKFVSLNLTESRVHFIIHWIIHFVSASGACLANNIPQGNVRRAKSKSFSGWKVRLLCGSKPSSHQYQHWSMEISVCYLFSSHWILLVCRHKSRAMTASTTSLGPPTKQFRGSQNSGWNVKFIFKQREEQTLGECFLCARLWWVLSYLLNHFILMITLGGRWQCNSYCRWRNKYREGSHLPRSIT